MFRKSPPAAPPPPALPARRFTDAAETPTTVIGPGTHIKGELNGDDPVDLAGTFEGHSRVNALYRLRETARVAGDVAAISIVVEGEVSGKMLAAEKIEIRASARVRANVRARVVAIAEGAFFDGEVHMEGREGPATTPLGFKEKRKGRPDE